MATISDVTIIDSNKAKAVPVDSGLERTICSPALCGSKHLLVYRRTILKGRHFNVEAGEDYHLVYVIEGEQKGRVHFKGGKF